MELALQFGQKGSDVMGLFKTRVLRQTAVLIVVCATPQIYGNDAYLHRVGAPPLRFSLATATFSFTLPAVLLPPPAPTNSPVVAPANTNSMAVSPAAIPIATVPVLTNSVQSTASNSPDNSASASDMLVVSPQMLTEYFQPGSEGTNTSTTAPVPVGFTPPLIKPSSQATYRSP